MFGSKQKWISIALVNLSILAFLGVVLRSKIIFSIPWIDFKNLLQAHSHFAFGGWITVCLLTLLTYEVLPRQSNQRPVYKWLLTGILLCAFGMLFSFPFEGYAFVSIFFSTSFMVVTYVFAWVYIKDLNRSLPSKSVRILSIASLLSMVISSVGPYILAFIFATHSVNTLLYKDAIYTYLHLQYNGFFTLGIFALFFNLMGKYSDLDANKDVRRFSLVLSVSVVPTLALSYLWHFETFFIRSIAIVGCACLVLTLVLFFRMLHSLRFELKNIGVFAKRVGLLSMIAFALKTLIQSGIIVPTIGIEVFGDRPIIIGYLHLVLLGFITLYLLSHLIETGYFSRNIRTSKTGIVVFATGIIVNELILMTQGLTAMMMMSSTIYPTLLLLASIWLFTGAALIMASSLGNFRGKFVV
jgi:hypothetical protein